MSWSELERLFEDAESYGELRRDLRQCSLRKELIHAVRALATASPA